MLGHERLTALFITDDIMENVSVVIAKLARMVNRYSDRKLRVHHLTTQQFMLLNAVYDNPLPVYQLAVRIGVDRTTVARNTERLVKSGLLEHQSHIDRRRRMCALTENGKLAVEEAMPTWIQIDNDLLEYIEGENIEGIIAKMIVLCTFRER